ncbi:MAG: methyltransferase domain-containing protein [Bdellovibrionales bacterium]|nr:methyltransferase domain-containing protein [Bdellovibrionales bacterium]
MSANSSYNPISMTLQYLKNFIKDRNVASIAPTTQATVKRVCRAIDFDKAKVIVEYGPGGGVFTRHLLDCMSPDARLVAVEKNPPFAQSLEKSINDDRLIVVCDGVERIKEILVQHGISQVDYIISGVPFSFFSEDVRHQLIKDTSSVLVPGGLFLVYQVNPDGLAELLSTAFTVGKPKREPFNLPPLCIYTAEKAAAPN